MRYTVIASVVVEKTAYRFDKPFDYFVPSELQKECQVGCRVTVPFGRGNSRRQGLVLSLSEGAVPTQQPLKNILSVVDKTPLFHEEQLALLRWLKNHTFCTYYDAVKTLIPFGLNLRLIPTLYLTKEASPALLSSLSADANGVVSYLRKKGGSAEKGAVLRSLGLTEGALCWAELKELGVISEEQTAKQNMRDPTVHMVSLADPQDEPTGLTKKQKAVVDLLREVGSAGVKEAAYFTGVSTAVIHTLEKKHIVRIFPMPTSSFLDEPTLLSGEEITLTEEQQTAYDILCRDIKADSPKTSLLYGVTGSGKTSVFLKLVDRVIEEGKSAIVMVPEISLTPQTIAKFRSRYGEGVAVFHSAMSLGRRLEEWKKAEAGKAVVAVGTRSAVFAPLTNIGLIIMDEEHEHTYKSEQSPRFHAREVAKVRCRYHNAMLLLASATPSVESYSLAKSGKYGLVTLKNRYGTAKLPAVETVDMRQETAVGNSGILSRRLVEELEITLQEKKQAILLLNRRGHNTYVSCPACGHVFQCENCSISFTYHSANQKLMCHYCGAAHAIPQECPACKNKKLRFSGTGTQRADEELAALFPAARILRLDADTTMTKDAFEKGLSAFSKGEYDILLGTQMVAKGLDFSSVTLVGVLSADQSMYSDDYRAFERTFSLLTQVIGRSGRGEQHGLAVVQTEQPDNDVIELACQQNYEGFYETEILTRKLMIYPPYCDIVMLGITAPTAEGAKWAAKKLFTMLTEPLKTSKPPLKMIVLGPTPATIPRMGGKYRQRLLLKTKNNAAFREFLNPILHAFYDTVDKSISVFVDINPESLL